MRKPSAEGVEEVSGECSLSGAWDEGTDFTLESLLVLCMGVLRKETGRAVTTVDNVQVN